MIAELNKPTMLPKTYKVLHIELMCLAKPKETHKQVKQGTGVLNSPYDGGIDDEDYDSDENWEEGGGAATGLHAGEGRMVEDS